MTEIPNRQNEVERFIAKYFPETPTGDPAANGGAYHFKPSPPATDDEVLEYLRAAKNAPKFSDLYDAGDVHRYHGGDDSAADAGLIEIMAYRTQDPDQLDSLFRGSALMRPKWDKKRGPTTYGRYTIQKVLKDYVRETYQDAAKLITGGEGKADLRNAQEEVSPSPSLKGQGHQGHPVPEKNHGDRFPRAAAFRELAQPEERRYLVGGGLVPAAYPTMIFGDGGSAKSLLAMSVGTSIATGADWLGHKVMQVPVLYLDFELDESEQARRAHQVARGAGLKKPPRDFYYLSALGYPVRDAFRAAYLECQRHHIGMLILDSLGPALEGDAEASRDVIGFYSRVMEPFRALGVGVFMVDHQAKLQAGERYQSKKAFGSVFKTNLARSVIQVEARDREEGRLALTLRQTKHNFGHRADPFGVVVEFSDEQITVRSEKLDPADLAEEGTINSIDRVRMALEDGPKYPADIAEATGLAVKTVKNALTKLRKNGIVVATGSVQHQAEEVSLVSSSLQGQGQGHLTDDYNRKVKKTMQRIQERQR